VGEGRLWRGQVRAEQRGFMGRAYCANDRRGAWCPFRPAHLPGITRPGPRPKRQWRWSALTAAGHSPGGNTGSPLPRRLPQGRRSGQDDCTRRGDPPHPMVAVIPVRHCNRRTTPLERGDTTIPAVGQGCPDSGSVPRDLYQAPHNFPDDAATITITPGPVGPTHEHVHTGAVP